MSEESTPKEKPKTGKVQRVRNWIGERITGSDATERMQETWGRIHQVGGFLPIFIEGKLELRSKKMTLILDEIENDLAECDTPDTMLKVIHKANMKVFMLFHKAGTQWIRGLKDRELAKKVSAYLEFAQRVADNPAFAWDFYSCSMEMLNISFLPQDVESVPPYLIETKTVIQPTQNRGASMDDAKDYK